MRSEPQVADLVAAIGGADGEGVPLSDRRRRGGDRQPASARRSGDDPVRSGGLGVRWPIGMNDQWFLQISNAETGTASSSRGTQKIRLFRGSRRSCDPDHAKTDQVCNLSGSTVLVVCVGHCARHLGSVPHLWLGGVEERWGHVRERSACGQKIRNAAHSSGNLCADRRRAELARCWSEDSRGGCGSTRGGCR